MKIKKPVNDLLGSSELGCMCEVTWRYEMTPREELKKEIYVALLEGIQGLEGRTRSMSWFWRSHFKRSAREESDLAAAA